MSKKPITSALNKLMNGLLLTPVIIATTLRLGMAVTGSNYSSGPENGWISNNTKFCIIAGLGWPLWLPYVVVVKCTER